MPYGNAYANVKYLMSVDDKCDFEDGYGFHSLSFFSISVRVNYKFLAKEKQKPGRGVVDKRLQVTNSECKEYNGEEPFT